VFALALGHRVAVVEMPPPLERAADVQAFFKAVAPVPVGFLPIGRLHRGDEPPHLIHAGRGRGVSIFLGKNRRDIGTSQSKRPPKMTQRPPHPGLPASRAASTWAA
jgi:hypothetical protein